MRLIDANAFARWLDQNHYVDKQAGKCDERQNRVLGIVISAVKNPEICPTVDAEPVRHGRWEYNSGDNIPYCNQCAMPQDVPTNYCHECGAKMDGGAENDH